METEESRPGRIGISDQFLSVEGFTFLRLNTITTIIFWAAAFKSLPMI